MTAKPITTPEKELVRVFEAAGVVDYLEYIQSGRRIMWVNFRAGIARGLGVTIGMTVVLGILIWILTLLVDLPFVGEYFDSAKQYVSEYAENTNYTDEFSEMTELLREMNEKLEN